MKKKSNIILNILLSLLAINIVIFGIQFNQLNFINRSIPMIGNFTLLLTLGLTIFVFYKNLYDFMKNKMIIIIIILVTLLNLVFAMFNISTRIFDQTMIKITSKENIYSSTIIVLKDSAINSIDDLNNKLIGTSDNEADYENYLLAHNYLETKNKITNNEFYKYADYRTAISDLLAGKIDALVISSSYIAMYSEYFEDIETKVRSIVSNIEKIVAIKTDIPLKDNDEPFTILVIGADTLTGGFNADVQILMTVNPTTKKVVQVDVVRDTYAYNIAAGKMDKITHAGWAGAENVVATVSKLFDIKIDYYLKFNFNSVVDLVDLMGGITMQVPYKYPADGKNTYYIYPGTRKLNGLETLMLARTRQAAGSNLQSRGRMQMKIIEAVTKQINSDFVINNFFNIFSVIQDNFQTNIAKSDLYYYLQKYISMKNDFTFQSNTLYGYNSTYYHEGMGRTLYTYKPDQNSLTELSNKLKANLVIE